MTQTYVSKVLKMPSLRYLKTSYKKGDVFIYARTKEQYLCCSDCKSKNVIKKGSSERTWKTAPNANGNNHIVVEIHRLKCKDCGALKQEFIRFAEKKKIYQTVRLICSFPSPLGDCKSCFINNKIQLAHDKGNR